MTVTALPAHYSLAIQIIVDRHDATGAQVRIALALIEGALLVAWVRRPADQRALTQPQFIQLVEHCRYPQVLDTALTTAGVLPLADRVAELVAELA